jgi:hypothetical protein
MVQLLAQLAHETGGLFFEISTDLVKGISRALADTREYYLRVYVSKNETSDGKYRRITVEVSDPKEVPGERQSRLPGHRKVVRQRRTSRGAGRQAC